MNQIIDIFHATDGYDITVLTNEAERKTFHFTEMPENLQEKVDVIIASIPVPKPVVEPEKTNNKEIILDEAYYSMLNMIESIWSTI